MRFLAIEHPVPGAAWPQGDDAAALLREEATGTWSLWRDGTLRGAWFRADRHEAVLLLECPDEAAADDVLAGLPLVRAGLIRFEVFGLLPYDGWGRLFAAG